MKIKMKREIHGMFHGINGVKVGDEVEVDDFNGARYCKLGYATPVVEKPKEEKAVPPKGEERRAVAKSGDAK